MKNPASPYLVADIFKVGIGIFMLTDSKFIVNFVERKRRKAVLTNDTDAVDEVDL